MKNAEELTNPLVSVIIPAYNHEKYIAMAVQSACTQTYSPVEVIVIDDGSNDGTRSVVRSLQDKYEFHFIENEKNIGLTKSLNTALKSAQGKYVSLLAGDDYWALDKIATQVTFMEQHPDVAACTGKVITIDEEGKPRRTIFKMKAKTVIYYDFAAFFELECTFPASAMVSKDMLTQIGGYDERFIMEDLPLWLKLSSTGWKLAVLPEVLGFYRVHGGNMHKNRGPMFENHLRLLEEYRDHPNYRRAVRAAYARQIKFGPSIGWNLLVICLVRGFSLRWSYARSLISGARSYVRSIGGE
jgi:alpha-1,3-rhamnosyltransferase